MYKKSDLKKYGVEWLILVNIVKGDLELVKKLALNNSIQWGELIEQAMSHKIFPMVSYCFLNDEDLFNLIPPFINQYFKICYDINKLKTKKIKEQVHNIDKILKKKNIKYAATKGVILDRLLYDDKGYRFLSDADFMTLPENKIVIGDALKEIGFDVGTVDWKMNEVRKMSREEYLRFLMAKDKIPEHVIEIKNDIIKYVSVGFVTSFTWSCCEYDVDVHNAFIKNVELTIDDSENEVSSLDITHHFIYIILHLYKHAMVEFLSRWNNDVNLVKFGDVYRYFNKFEDIILTELPELMEKYNIEKPIFWTLYHTDSIFNSKMVEKLKGVEFVKNNKKYLNSAKDEKGNIRYFKGTMMERLVSKNRKELFVSEFKEV